MELAKIVATTDDVRAILGGMQRLTIYMDTGHIPIVEALQEYREAVTTASKRSEPFREQALNMLLETTSWPSSTMIAMALRVGDRVVLDALLAHGRPIQPAILQHIFQHAPAHVILAFLDRDMGWAQFRSIGKAAKDQLWWGALRRGAGWWARLPSVMLGCEQPSRVGPEGPTMRRYRSDLAVGGARIRAGLHVAVGRNLAHFLERSL